MHTYRVKKAKAGGRKASLLFMLLPAVVLVFLFNYIPIYGIVIAFKDFSPFQGIFKSPWVGFKYFHAFLTDSTFWTVMKNTLIINFYDVIFGFTAPILFALLLNEMMNRHAKKIIQTISYLPHFLSWVIVAGIFYQMLSPGQSGIINGYLVKFFGIQPVYFMAEEKYFVAITVFAEIWKSVGWSAILYFATLAGIDPTLYEVSHIDGASRPRQILHITLPALAPVISLMLVLKISTIFTIGFERLFVLQNSLVLSVSEVISTYVYRSGLLKSQFSFTTAIGLTQSGLGFLLLLGCNKVSRRLTGTGLY